MTIGTDLITAERERQIREEGWSREHDSGHSEELALAGVAYAAGDHDIEGMRIRDAMWPWDERWLKPTSRFRDLVKAGALIAAAIDDLVETSPSGQF